MNIQSDLPQFEDLNDLALNLIPETPAFLEKNASKRTLLEDPEAPAIAVYKSAEKLLSKDIDVWEPETVWMEAHTKGIDIPEENRNKIMALSALRTRDPLIYAASTFKNLVLVLNNELPNTEILEEAFPEQISWMIECLRQFDSPREYHLDYEPVYYTAAVLHRDGYFLAPKNLEFAQQSLDKLNRNAEIKEELAKALKKPEQDMNDLEREQFLKMERVVRYVAHRNDELKKALELCDGR